MDVLSGGRAWLGIGAAWNDEESAGLGIPFPPVAERFERLEETLQIVHRMFDGNEEPFAGKYFQLARPLNSPAPLTRPHPPIMIGGSGEKKTLKLVARYADACNLFPTPDVVRKLDVLRRHCENEGRDYDTVYKTLILRMNVGPDGRGVDDLLTRLRGYADLGIQAVIGQVADVSTIKPLEVMGRDVIPVAESF